MHGQCPVWSLLFNNCNERLSILEGGMPLPSKFGTSPGSTIGVVTNAEIISISPLDAGGGPAQWALTASGVDDETRRA